MDNSAANARGNSVDCRYFEKQKKRETSKIGAENAALEASFHAIRLNQSNGRF